MENKTKKIVGIILCLLGVVSVIFGCTKLFDSRIQEYEALYTKCEAEYRETKALAASADSFLRPTYQSLVQEYTKMMDEAQKQIWSYRGPGIAFGCIGLVALGIGVVFLVKDAGLRKKGDS